MESLGKFLPKSFIPLRDAIEQLGSKLVSGWSGDEQTAEIWEGPQSYSVLKEKENWLADRLGQICVEEWGEPFIQAASDYDPDPFDPNAFAISAKLVSRKEEIEE